MKDGVVQSLRLGPDTLLLVDEAHNFGSQSLRSKLYSNIDYRLALSATLDRHGDEDGTAALVIKKKSNVAICS